jgi:hypothetical protein
MSMQNLFKLVGDYKETLHFLNEKQKILILHLGKYGIWFLKILGNN